jgi:hypothetical protein
MKRCVFVLAVCACQQISPSNMQQMIAGNMDGGLDADAMSDAAMDAPMDSMQGMDAMPDAPPPVPENPNCGHGGQSCCAPGTPGTTKGAGCYQSGGAATCYSNSNMPSGVCYGCGEPGELCCTEEIYAPRGCRAAGYSCANDSGFFWRTCKWCGTENGPCCVGGIQVGTGGGEDGCEGALVCRIVNGADRCIRE